jgi:hypothetical protein
MTPAHIFFFKQQGAFMNKKYIVGLLMVGVFPVMALAAGNHSSGHDMKGNDMSSQRKSSPR